jgi:hypothetical protein
MSFRGRQGEVPGGKRLKRKFIYSERRSKKRVIV